MVAGNRISAVLCSTDLVESQEFYEQKVGLKLSPETIKNHLVFEPATAPRCSSTAARNPNLADHTQVRFWSKDVAADVKELRERGVVFEEYDFPTFKTVDSRRDVSGIGTSAWFKDPDGNTIAVFQPE